MLNRRHFLGLLAAAGVIRPGIAHAEYYARSRRIIKGPEDETYGDVVVYTFSSAQGKNTFITSSRVTVTFYPLPRPYEKKDYYIRGFYKLKDANDKLTKFINHDILTSLAGFFQTGRGGKFEGLPQGQIEFNIKGDGANVTPNFLRNSVKFKGEINFNFVFATPEGKNFMTVARDKLQRELNAKKDTRKIDSYISSPASLVFTSNKTGVVYFTDLWQSAKLSYLKNLFETGKRRVRLSDFYDSDYLKLSLVNYTKDYKTGKSEELLTFQTSYITALMNSIPKAIATNKQKLLDSKGKVLTAPCVITTAACQLLGLADDCRELTALRAFRDDYLKPEEVQEYYRLSHEILARPVMKETKGARALLRFYYLTVLPCLLLLKFGQKRLCRAHYKRSVERLAVFVKTSPAVREVEECA